MVALRVTSVSLFLALAACSVGTVPIGGTPPVDGPGPIADAPVATTDGPVGTIDAPGGGGEQAATYMTKIFPLVSNETNLGKACNSSGCHTPGGQPPDFSSYTTFAEKYRIKPGDTAKVVIKGAHSGPALTATSKQAFIDWINL